MQSGHAQHPPRWHRAAETEGKEANASEDAIRALSDQITDLLKEYETQAETALKEKTEDITTV